MNKPFKLTFLIVLAVLLISLVSCELTTPEPSKGTLRVFAYGNNYGFKGYNPKGEIVYYEDCQINGLGGLNTCNNDATGFAEAIKLLNKKTGMYNFDEDTNLTLITSISEDNPSVNKKNASSRDNFLSVLRNLQKDGSEEAQSNDTFILYYSGHGGYDGTSYKTLPYGTDVRDKAYICCSGVNATSGYNECQHITMKELCDELDKIKGKKIVILDSCFSGSLVLADGITINQNVWPDKSVNVFNLYNSSNANVSNDTFVLTAARYFETSVTSYTYSAFTKILLEALGYDDGTISSIPAQNGKYLTIKGIYNYLKKNYDGKTNNKITNVYSTTTGGSLDLVLFQF